MAKKQWKVHNVICEWPLAKKIKNFSMKKGRNGNSLSIFVNKEIKNLSNCRINYQESLQSLLQTLGSKWQLQGISYTFEEFLRCPRWPFSCMAWVPLLAKHAEQYLHLNGFSPVCTFLCSKKLGLCAKPLPQISHWNFFWSFGVCWDCMCLKHWVWLWNFQFMYITI